MFDHVIYFLIGCPRTGSSYLYKTLKNVENINLLPKDNHFFLSKNLVEKANYFSSPKYFHNSSIKYYLKKLSLEKINYDVNTFYFYDIKTLKTIKKFFPKSKFFCFLRDPINRHYSHAITQIKKYYLYKNLGSFQFSIDDFYDPNKSIFFKNQFLTFSNYKIHKKELKKNKINCYYFSYEKLFSNKKNYEDFLKKISIKKINFKVKNKIHSKSNYPIKYNRKSIIEILKFSLFSKFYFDKVNKTINLFNKNYPTKIMKKIYKTKDKNLEKFFN